MQSIATDLNLDSVYIYYADFYYLLLSRIGRLSRWCSVKMGKICDWDRFN